MSKASKSSSKKTSAKKESNVSNFAISATKDEMKARILGHLAKTLARAPEDATKHEWQLATCIAVRDFAWERMLATMDCHHEAQTRRMYYLSLEYLMGRLLNNNLFNTGLVKPIREALSEIGKDMDELLFEESDMGLGNGGLGRLAACFLDSLATLDLPAIGYGINYEFGLFRQSFDKLGHQIESPDNWMRFGNPWQIIRADHSVEVNLYGRVETRFSSTGDSHQEWVDCNTIIGVPWDIPIVGYGAHTVNFLRLWESRASSEFNLSVFNAGGYIEAVREKAVSETISKVLYPNDSTESGKELRLVQQYFFVTCSLKDIIRRFRKSFSSWDNFPEQVTVQLNDTHPAVAVVELMRILIDEERLPWEYAWEICQKVFNYTNHTLLPEALERWSVPLFQKVLPRHLQIIYEINRRFLLDVVDKKWPGDDQKKTALSLIEERQPKMIRMASLSVLGSRFTNGVAALHTELLKTNLFQEFNELYPERFQNKTNGITPRRWLLACNPNLSNLITSKIGDSWITDLDKLHELLAFADDAKFQEEFMSIKIGNKRRLAKVIKDLCDVDVDTNAIFDVQIKRLHEYKRQHLNLLHILVLYHRLLANPQLDISPRVFIFGAKAAPGYTLAKAIIQAINCMATVINNDQRINGKLKVIFLPNYSVSLAEIIIPAADISEQISTAGKEASGTGNMKLALNGALTIGTLDGANVEIMEEVGKDNIFIFGMTVNEVEELRSKGYKPWDYYWANDELRNAIDWLCSGYFCPEEPHAFDSIRYSLLDGGDPFMVLADFDAYCKAHDDIDAAYKNKKKWAKMAIHNTACVGKFSSDRTIREYAEQIWFLKPIRPQCRVMNVGSESMFA